MSTDATKRVQDEVWLPQKFADIGGATSNSDGAGRGHAIDSRWETTVGEPDWTFVTSSANKLLTQA